MPERLHGRHPPPPTCARASDEAPTAVPARRAPSTGRTWLSHVTHLSHSTHSTHLTVSVRDARAVPALRRAAPFPAVRTTRACADRHPMRLHRTPRSRGRVGEAPARDAGDGGGARAKAAAARRER